MAPKSFRSPFPTETSPSATPCAETIDDRDLAERLREAGVSLTLQRLAIARVLMPQPVHLTADQVWGRAKAILPEVSRATVYNTLDLFERAGLVRRLAVDAEKVVFDSVPTPHHHIHDATSGEIFDIAPGAIEVVGLPHLPPDVEVAEVDVVIRVRRREG